jgi:hypothetical protein
MENEEVSALIRDFVIELVVYGALVLAYSMIVLRWLADPLRELFHNNLPIYALLSLGLIVAQGAALDAITTFLLSLLPMGRLE